MTQSDKVLSAQNRIGAIAERAENSAKKAVAFLGVVDMNEGLVRRTKDNRLEYAIPYSKVTEMSPSGKLYAPWGNYTQEELSADTMFWELFSDELRRSGASYSFSKDDPNTVMVSRILNKTEAGAIREEWIQSGELPEDEQG